MRRGLLGGRTLETAASRRPYRRRRRRSSLAVGLTAITPLAGFAAAASGPPFVCRRRSRARAAIRARAGAGAGPRRRGPGAGYPI